MSEPSTLRISNVPEGAIVALSKYKRSFAGLG